MVRYTCILRWVEKFSVHGSMYLQSGITVKALGSNIWLHSSPQYVQGVCSGTLTIMDDRLATIMLQVLRVISVRTRIRCSNSY